MSRDLAQKTDPIESNLQLRAFFESGSKGPDAALGIGTEHEKPGYLADSLKPIPYEGPSGIGALLGALVERYAWSPILDDGRILALERDGGAVTLEPGGQLELSGRITNTIFETRDELVRHLTEVRDVGNELGQRWTHFGLQPWDDLDDVPWMPKSRYRVMRDYMPKVGTLGHWMMKMTCTVQANLDYRDERDAIELIGVIARVSPLVTAMFANSPVRFAQPTGDATFRMRVWEDTDSARSGNPSHLFNNSATFDDHVEWALDVPMYFVTRNGRYIDMTGRTFREFLRDGLDGQPATLGDWELHLSTVFPDVRLKKYVETRTADAGPPAHLLALSALWKGIGYDARARQSALEAADVSDVHEARTLAAAAARQGLNAVWKGKTLRERAGRLVDAASAGLDAQAGLARGPSERVFLAPLRDGQGVVRSPSEAFLTLWNSCGGDRRTMIEAYSIDRLLDAVL
jgi:glutamate--cysteine ligase